MKMGRIPENGSFYLSGHDDAEKYFAEKSQRCWVNSCNVQCATFDTRMMGVPTYRDMMTLKNVLPKNSSVALEDANLHEKYLQSKFNQDVNMMGVPAYGDTMTLENNMTKNSSVDHEDGNLHEQYLQ